MYDERPTTTQILLTSAAWIIGIGVIVFGVGTLVLASLSGPQSSVTSAPAAQAPQVETVGEAAAAAETTVSASELAAEPTPAPLPAPTPQPAPTVTGVVCIDAGHQLKADSSSEPIGPGASETKPKVAGGTRGVSSRVPESQAVLEISLKLRDVLVARGVTVVMVRETQDVNIANSERAAIANDANADLFIRLHCDGANSSSAYGLSTLVPKSNSWTAPIVDASRQAADLVHPAVIAKTGAKDNGIVGRADLSGFNWAKVPTILVEMGFMTNPAEDARLNDPAYQQQLAEGMADGIVEYLQVK